MLKYVNSVEHLIILSYVTDIKICEELVKFLRTRNWLESSDLLNGEPGVKGEQKTSGSSTL